MLIISALITTGSCKANPDYCEGAPHHNCMDLIDAPLPLCTGDMECSGPMGVCDVETGLCVQCTPTDNPCATATPVCAANQCQKCTMHAECRTSNVCLPDGTCADATQVAYVQSDGTGAPPCAKDAPCGTLADGVTANKPTVKMATGTVADSETTTIDGKTVTILADPGAKLTRNLFDGSILEVKGSSDVKIYDLEIAGATGAGGDGIDLTAAGNPSLTLTRVTVAANASLGISATGGTLTVSASMISGNQGGGIKISGSQFDITNCFIVGNGGGSSGLGGVDLSQILTATGAHRLDFNTIAANLGPLAIAVNTGVNCTTIGAPFIFNSNIIYGNAVNGGGKQLGGDPMCSASYSDVGPDPALGATNINMPPMFVNAAQGDFHLINTSPAKDAADPAATLTQDIDGDTRPQGPGRDMGADEIRQ